MKTLLQKEITFFPGDQQVWINSTTHIPPFGSVENAKANRVLNSQSPIAQWETSLRTSNVRFAYQRILLPETTQEAIVLLRSLNGASIVFDDIPYVCPVPFGIVWINLQYSGPRKAYGIEQCHRNCQILEPHKNVNGYLGNRYYQDGSKFASLSPFIVVLRRNWIPKLRKELSLCLDIHAKDKPVP